MPRRRQLSFPDVLELLMHTFGDWTKLRRRQTSYKSKEFVSSDDSSTDIDEIGKSNNETVMKDSNTTMDKQKKSAKRKYKWVKKLPSSSSSESEARPSVPSAGPSCDIEPSPKPETRPLAPTTGPSRDSKSFEMIKPKKLTMVS